MTGRLPREPGGGRRPHGSVAVTVIAVAVIGIIAVIVVAGGVAVIAAAATGLAAAATGVATGAAGAVAVVGFVVGTIGVIVGIRYREEGAFRLVGLLSGAVRHAARGRCPGGAGLMAGTGWRVMRLVARLMPPAEGRRWLAEAESFLAEAPPALRRGAIGSYLTSTPQVITVSWAGVLTRQARRALRGRAAPR